MPTRLPTPAQTVLGDPRKLEPLGLGPKNIKPIFVSRPAGAAEMVTWVVVSDRRMGEGRPEDMSILGRFLVVGSYRPIRREVRTGEWVSSSPQTTS